MIYTSYFNNYGRLFAANPNLVFISIAGKMPDYFNHNEILKYSKLAPNRDWWNVWHDKFNGRAESLDSQKFYIEKYYETVLNKLDPNEVKTELLEMSDRRNVVLMCYEIPDKFCHRHIVSEWFRQNGIECGEHICPMLINNLFKLKNV